MEPLKVGPADVLAVAGGTSFVDWGIRFFEFIGGQPDLSWHCVVVTHQDAQGRWIGISGQAGGVGLCDVTRYLTQKWTRSNHAQPRPNDSGQTDRFLASCAKSLGISYDWVGIAVDATADAGLHDVSEELARIWAWPTNHNLLPGHVVCSSLAAYLYGAVGWPHPEMGNERLCSPGDWWDWNESQGWET